MNIMEWIITSSILLALILAIRQLFKEKLSARVRYGMWLIVLIRLLLPISFTGSSASVLNLIPENRANIQAQDNWQDGASFNPSAKDDSAIWDPPTNTIMGSQQASGTSLVGKTDSGLQNPNRNMLTTENIWSSILSGIWIAGMIVCGVVLLGSNLVFMRKLRLTRRLMSPHAFNAHPNNCPHASRIPVYASGLVNTPCLFGLFRPAIYIRPEDANNSNNLPYILKHEYTHYRHGDHIWAFCRSLCLVLHWYNPLVWVGAYWNRQDGELACDESVTAGMEDTNRLEYGRILIDLTKGNGPYDDMLCCATTMSGGKKNLKERVTRITWQRKLLLVPTAAVIALCLAVTWVTFTAAKEDTAPQENTQPNKNGDNTDADKASNEPTDDAADDAEGNTPDGQSTDGAKADNPEEFEGAERLVNVMFADVTHDGVEDAIFTTVGFFYEEEASLSIDELLQSIANYTAVRVYDGNTFSDKYSTDKEKWAQLALEGVIIDGEQYPSAEEAIYEKELANAHVGNGMVFLTWQDGEAYLMDSSNWTGQGMGDFSYQVFSLDSTGAVSEKDSGNIGFSLSNFLGEKWEDIFPVSDMLAYTEQIAPWIENGTVVDIMDVMYDPIISKPRQNHTIKPWEIWNGFLCEWGTPTGMADLEKLLNQVFQELIAEDEFLAEPAGDSPEDMKELNDYTISMGDLTISLYESKEDITAKLAESGLSYSEYDPRSWAGDKYDSYYAIDESLHVYFADNICVRLTLTEKSFGTARGIHKGDSYSKLIEQYGDSFETHTYAAHGVYTIYRYSFENYICEFGILDDYPLGNIDIYDASLSPIYDYGELLD